MHMTTTTRWLAALAIAASAAACKDKGGDAGEDTEASSSSGTGDATGDPSGDPSGSPTSAPTSTSASTTTASTTNEPTTSTMSATDPTDDTTEPDSTGDPDTGPVGDAIYEEDFSGNDGDPWPAPWEIAGDGITQAELDGGRGRMAGITMHTSRMILPGFDELDAEMYVTVTFDDPSAQGFGFYCRQNGGALQDTDPPGQGYAVFFEGAYMRGIGIWREIDGVEELLSMTPEAIPGGLSAGTPYRIRYQCRQDGDITNVRAKVWPADEAEPEEWRVSVDDDTPQLQNLSGSFAADIYNYAGTGGLYVDDVWIAAL